MWASRVFLRWYKSFNTRYHGYIEPDAKPKMWEMRSKEFFPFVEVPLQRRIATIVGANESGKSHLLSAVEKIMQGWSTSENGEERYDIQHICRYCALDSLEEEVWPNIGLELSFTDDNEYQKCVDALHVTPSSTPNRDSERVLRAFIDGSQPSERFATIFDHADGNIGSINKEEWFTVCGSTFPAVEFINSKLALSNEVHVQQLLDMYDEKKPSPAYDPLALQDFAAKLFDLRLEPDKPPSAEEIQHLTELRETFRKSVLGPGEPVQLETLLFNDILQIDAGTLHRIKKLGAGNRGYVERIVEEINHRLFETLDISQFWQQDDDFTLQVEYKGGFFYFLITDKTGAKYTFNERSSGLRYFLSYYIQAKAIKQSVGTNGAIVLMDEPDSFLSAAGQRNLLQVFESLVDVTPGTGSVQLIYTTHSPFMINRNFPDRISLVRKGDGSEGSQLVAGSARRRYEPVRSGLGIDCAETLFMGSMNVVLEGLSDQKVLVSAIQKFGNPTRIDELLDLNKITFVSADGAWNVPPLVEKSTSGSEKRPVVVAFLDGDKCGEIVAHELVEGKLLERDFIATIPQVGMAPSWNESPKELEDIIPPEMLAVTVAEYLRRRWNENVDAQDVQGALTNPSNGAAMKRRLVEVTKEQAGAEAKSLSDIEVRGGLFDVFVDLLLDTSEFEATDQLRSGLSAFEQNVRAICAKLQDMLSAAETRSRRDRLRKNVRLAIERFEKAHRRQASKADMERCLQRIDDECTGGTEPARLAKDNVSQLRTLLDEQVTGASVLVEIESWLPRLRTLWECPWKVRKDGWR